MRTKMKIFRLFAGAAVLVASAGFAMASPVTVPPMPLPDPGGHGGHAGLIASVAAFSSPVTVPPMPLPDPGPGKPIALAATFMAVNSPVTVPPMPLPDPGHGLVGIAATA